MAKKPKKKPKDEVKIPPKVEPKKTEAELVAEKDRIKKKILGEPVENALGGAPDDGFNDSLPGAAADQAGEPGADEEKDLQRFGVGPHRRKKLVPIIRLEMAGLKMMLANKELKTDDQLDGYAQGLMLAGDAAIESMEILLEKYLGYTGEFAEEAVAGSAAVIAWKGSDYLDAKLQRRTDSERDGSRGGENDTEPSDSEPAEV